MTHNDTQRDSEDFGTGMKRLVKLMAVNVAAMYLLVAIGLFLTGVTEGRGFDHTAFFAAFFVGIPIVIAGVGAALLNNWLHTGSLVGDSSA